MEQIKTVRSEINLYEKYAHRSLFLENLCSSFPYSLCVSAILPLAGRNCVLAILLVERVKSVSKWPSRPAYLCRQRRIVDVRKREISYAS